MTRPFAPHDTPPDTGLSCRAARVRPPAAPAQWSHALPFALTAVLVMLRPGTGIAWVGERDAGRLPSTTAPLAKPAPAEPMAEGTPGGPPRLDVKGEPTAGAYVLRVQVRGGRPEAVQVIPRGQALDLSLSTEGSSELRSGTARDATKRSGYHGSVHRRVPLPADADLARVTREVRGDTLLLRVPRRPAPPGARPAVPARPAGTR